MKKFVVFAIILGAIALMAVLSRMGGPSAVEVQIEEATRGRLSSFVMASGKINFRENIQLRTEVTGRIETVFVEEGDKVSKGDTLAIIMPELFEADVLQARALTEARRIDIERQEVALSQLEREFERRQELFHSGHIDKDSFEKLQRDVAIAKLDLSARRQDLVQAEASLASAEDRLRKTVITSPIDGIVTALNVKGGETVVAGTTNIIGSSLMDVSDPSAVVAEVDVSETDILAVRVGQKADIVIAAAPNQRYPGSVLSIATTAREDSNGQRSFLVKILIDEDGDAFSRLAMSCRAEIYTDVVEDTIKVPVEAILHDTAGEDGTSGEAYVYLVKDGIAQKQVVEVGLQTDTESEIRSGLEAGTHFVVGPYRILKSLRAGQKVTADSRSGNAAYGSESR